jgi:hypothetical protein
VSLAGLPIDVPVDPEPPEAAQWLIEELAKPVYQAAKPTLFDRIAQAIGEWIASLRFGDLEGPPALALGFVVALIVVGIVVAILIFGLPRLNRRSAVTGALFGEEDERSAARIARDAEAAARRGDWSLAIAETFRSIARDLAERTIVTTSPGTTAHEFASRAGRALPSLAEPLAVSAATFDGVRYLGHVGSAEQYRAIAELAAEARGARPALEPVES